MAARKKKAQKKTHAPAKETLGIITIELEVRLDAPPKRVWRALAEETPRWWPREFHTSEATRAFIMEPKPGGRVYEDWGKGNGRLWYTVITAQKNALLELSGHLFPEYGGPASTSLTLRLREDGDGTVLSLQDVVMGRVSNAMRESLEQGWKMLFQDAFKAYVERPRKR